jgi:orotate phosphoribosyltransferase
MYYCCFQKRFLEENHQAMNPSDTILLQLIREKSLKFGDFTLASGKKATYYLDGKQVTLDAFGAKLIGEGILHLMLRNGKLPDLVGGMSIGADPITAAVLTMAAVNGHALRGCMIRKEPKGHGTKKYIEGPVQPGDRIIVLEDVVTTGGSSLLAMERLEEAGIVVDGVIAVIDRMEGGAETFRQKGCRFQSLLTIRDFGIEPPK